MELVEIMDEKQLLIERSHNQTNFLFPFHLKEMYRRLIIQFHYGPAYATEEEALPLILTNLKHYIPDDREVNQEKARKFLPLENLITLSLSYNNQYLGARHTKERDLEVFISAEKASLGFPLQAIQAGEWELQLNVHCAASEKIYGSVSILAERMEEL
ncbi:MAG TPA: hypothetical protein H9946_12420 [Candidatus Jeotgalibaca pullicola]|nr:hypothetical protein [Candidatus Jeotgalibaca pullicola]